MHTKGPWKATGTKAEGNARLIAASPRLLEACKAFLDVWHRAGPLGSAQFEKFDHAVRLAEAAIAEAEVAP